MPEPKSPYKRVRRAFSQAKLKRVCEMHELDFRDEYNIDKWIIDDHPGPENYFYYQDNGSDILAVAHLDTVVGDNRRQTTFVNTGAGPVVHSGALDDRLGAYTILELLPSLGIQYDILLTVGEESGASTAQFFDPPEGKEYNWMIEFDRGGTDVVMYQYEDYDLKKRVEASGARSASGIFSDISYMEHLEIKGCNWGVGYRDYHTVRGYAYLEDYWMMIGHYLNFHEANKDGYLPHEKRKQYASTSRYGGSGWSGSGGFSSGWSNWGSDEAADWAGAHTHDDDPEIDAETAAILEDLEDIGFEEEAEFAEDIVSDDFNTVKQTMKELEAGPSASVN